MILSICYFYFISFFFHQKEKNSFNGYLFLYYPELKLLLSYLFEILIFFAKLLLKNVFIEIFMNSRKVS